MNQLPKSIDFFYRQNVVNEIKLASIFNKNNNENRQTNFLDIHLTIK